MLHTFGKLLLEDTSCSRLKSLILLVYLSLEGPQSRTHLSQVFWPNAKNPAGALSVTLTRLRKIHSSSIESDLYVVKSNIPTDALRFARAVEQGASDTALKLYTGSFLEGVTLPNWSGILESWVYETREAFADSARQCLLKLAKEYVEAGDINLAVHYAERTYQLPSTSALQPEVLQFIYSLLSAHGSKLTDAVATEANEFGLTLSVPSFVNRCASEKPERGNVPLLSGSLVGRQEEIKVLSARLAAPDCRLLTLTGMGGVGKSQLALALAHEHRASVAFQDGVYVAMLENLQSPDRIPARIAEALKLSSNSQELHLELIESFLNGQRVLLVLDNFEHLLEGALFLSELLVACPLLTCLVTSRTRLNLKNECVYRVGGLTYPTLDEPLDTLLEHDAPQLFAQRAKSALMNFSLMPADYPYIVQLCNLTDGMPLALELAAAWLRVMPLSEVVREIGGEANFLSSAYRDGNERHRSISSILEQSWRYVEGDERDALLKLSVFEGGFTREAAAQVANASLETLTSLADASMVNREVNGRYKLHPLTKQYLEKQLVNLDKADAAKKRHAAYFLDIARRTESHFESIDQSILLKQLENELDNLRATLRWSIDGVEVETALELAARLERFWRVRNPAEGLSWLSRLVELPIERHSELRVNALKVAGNLAEICGELDTAHRYLQEGLYASEALENQVLRGDLLYHLGVVVTRLGNQSLARAYTEESFELRRNLRNSRKVAKSLNHLGTLEMLTGNYTAARTCYEESLAIHRATGDELEVATLLVNLGRAENEQGKYLTAKRHYNECLTINKRLKHRYGVAMVLNNLGVLEENLGNFTLAQTYYRECLMASEDIKCNYLTANVLLNLSGLAVARGEWVAAQEYLAEGLLISSRQSLRSVAIQGLEEAAKLAYSLGHFTKAAHVWGSIEGLREAIEEPLPIGLRQDREQMASVARESISDQTFDTVWEAGQKSTFEEAISFALEF